ncbi:MAG: helix-turn-helix transcriptional regulator [Pseudomonadota bacterium]
MTKEKVTKSSGNVFADLGLEDAGELHAKAALALQIKRIIKRRGLTQVQAGKLLGLPRADVSRLMNGELDRFSTQRLISATMRCDRDIEIVVKRRPASRKESRLSVRAA